jgi:hypothetical protein
MEILAYILFWGGLLFMLFYGLYLVVIAFQESILWGLGYLFVPFVNIVFIIMYWQQTKGPFLKGLVSSATFVVGMVMLSPDTQL